MFLRKLATVVGSTLLAGCSVVGVRSGTEQPKYDLVERIGESVEVRHYGERVAAQVTVNRGRRSSNENAAFGALAGYIFGKNKAQSDIAMTAPVQTAVSRQSEKIAMTSPVSTSTTADSMTMRFFLPAAYTVESAPEPLNPNVNVVTVEPETIASLRFTGLRSSANVATHTAELLDHLADTQWAPVGEPSAFFYDPPWTVPTLRRNEIVVRVEKREG